jgi:twitching motility two-component system response regulator PilG
MPHEVSFRSDTTGSAPPGEQKMSISQNRVNYLHVAPSIPPQASSYPLFLPPLQQTLQPSQFPSSSPQVQHSQRKFIMVIDDSATVRKILETCLGREGFEVKGFHDGVEAMRWLTEPQARIPDLVILDIGLPKMDGYEVARRLKAKPQFANTVIVMLTRRDGVIDRLKGRLAGAKEYMTKPFKTQEVVKVVQFFLGITPAEQEATRQPCVVHA